MKITVKRFKFLETCTIGKLFIDDRDLNIFTLEDKFREIEGPPVESWKVQNETAIPKGIYKVIIDYSDHFGKDLPHILNVPGFSGVRIHPGNSDKDTEGCILVGKNWNGSDFIGESKDAFLELLSKLPQDMSTCTIEIL